MAANNSQLFIKAAILLLLVSLASGYDGTGPFVVKDLHVLPCEDQGTNEMNVEMQMYRTQDRTKRVLAHRGAMSWPPGDDTYRLFTKVLEKGTDWILLVDYDDEFCKVVSRIPKLWGELYEHLGIKGNPCPPPPGHYTFDEWVINFDGMFPVLPYGEYKAIARVLNGKNETIGCFLTYTTIVKKYFI